MKIEKNLEDIQIISDKKKGEKKEEGKKEGEIKEGEKKEEEYISK